MERKDHWIDQTLETKTFIQSAEPSNDLMSRLRNIPNTISENYDKIPKKVVWAVAASIAILVCMNFISLKEYKTNSSNSTQSAELVDSHFSYLKHL